MSDIKFVDGLIVKAPHEKAPDFVKCSISIKRKDLGNWLRAQDGDWINIDVKESKNGKWYAAVNDWKPDQKNDPAEHASGNRNQKNPTYSNDKLDDDLDSDIPF